MKKYIVISFIVLCIYVVLFKRFKLNTNFENYEDDKKKGVILMYCTDNIINDWGKYSIEINKKYADKHGYDFVLLTKPYDKNVTHAWQKIPAMLELLNRYDFVMYIDTDAIFYKQDKKIEGLFKKYHGDILVCSDEKNSNSKYLVNGGVIIAKNSKKAKDILNFLWSLRYKYKEFAFEQWALSDIVKKEYDQYIDSSVISVAPETEFNSIYSELMDRINNKLTLPDTYILHFMATSDNFRRNIFSSIQIKIEKE